LYHEFLTRAGSEFTKNSLPGTLEKLRHCRKEKLFARPQISKLKIEVILVLGLFPKKLGEKFVSF
jgi:hypothetical protein